MNDASVEQVIYCRPAAAEDVRQMTEFIFAHGENEWNYLPREEVTAHLADIATGKVYGMLAFCEGIMAGFATYSIGNHYPQYEGEKDGGPPRGYIAEAVVHRGYSGRGIGTRLLAEVKADLARRSVATVYIKRHADNAASAGMMRKAGFVEVDVFFDPEIRKTGSRRTSVSRLRLREVTE